MGCSISLHGGVDLPLFAKLPEIPFQVRRIELQPARAKVPLDDAAMENLAPFTKLETLVLWSCPITNAGFRRLASFPGLSKLTYLKLVGSSVTDDGLADLARFPELDYLSLEENSAITDATAGHVRKLPKLRELRFVGTNLTDTGLAEFRNLPLAVLYIDDDVRVTDAGMPHVGTLVGLSRLHLHGTRVSDAGLVHVKNLSKMSTLTLVGSPITDEGLVPLEGMTALRSLGLQKTEVSAAGVKRLHEKLPNCTIQSDHGVLTSAKGVEP
jgi:hypothetical protein